MGIDGGNWLALGHSLFGEHIRSETIQYPPIVPLLAVAAEIPFGPYGGLQAIAYVSALAPMLGAYIYLYNSGLRWRAVVLSSFLGWSSATGDAMAWGGYPQLLGL